MLGKVFKAYDVRAIYPKPLNEKLAWQIGYATARYLTEKADEAGYDDPMMRHFVVGRDMRQSSPSLADALKEGIRAFGSHVIDLGLVDTPMIYFAINYFECCGGIQVTASHNPANYNGFKVSGIQAKPIGMTTGLDDIRRYAALIDQNKVAPAGGREDVRDLWDSYREHVLYFMPPSILDGSKTINVVIDASNGMAGTMVPKLFSGIPGLKITKLNFDNSTGEFVHEPNPLVESNLQMLRDKVISSKAHLGICFDGDADRCVVVDEKGQTIGCDLLTAWLSRKFLADNPKAAVVFDLRSSKSLSEIIIESGGRPIKSRVGHVFMKEKMANHKAVFGGELSGHFYFRDNFYADSGAIAFASVISGLAENEGPLSELIKPARRYVQSGEINFETDDKQAAMEDLINAYPDAQVEELDGITLNLGSWWFNVRPSNTEPLLRLNLEGADEESVKTHLNEVSKFLGKRVGH